MGNEDILVIALLTGFVFLVFFIITHSTNQPSSPNPRKQEGTDDTGQSRNIKNDSSG